MKQILFFLIASFLTTVSQSFAESPKIETAKEAYVSCLKKSGCSLVRDAIDKRIIKSIINKIGKVIDSQNDVGGFDLYQLLRVTKHSWRGYERFRQMRLI